jgi:integrase/recombinase XerC
MNHQESFIHYLRFEKRMSGHTSVAYENDINQFVSFGNEQSEGFDIILTDRKMVRGWVVSLMEKKLSPRSVHRKISSLQAFFRYLMKMEVITDSPVNNIPLPKIRKKLPGFVEENKLHHLLDDGFFTDDFSGERDKMTIALLYATGIRLSELAKLRTGDVDLGQFQIKVTGKRNKQRIIPFSRSLGTELEEYLQIREQVFPESGDVFLLTDKGEPVYNKLIYRIVKSYLSLVTSLERKSPHILRHTYATHLLNKGADLNAVKELLGHANLGATEIYTHTTFEKLHKIYQQAHPRG